MKQEQSHRENKLVAARVEGQNSWRGNKRNKDNIRDKAYLFSIEL